MGRRARGGVSSPHHSLDYLQSLVDKMSESGYINKVRAEELKSLSQNNLRKVFHEMTPGLKAEDTPKSSSPLKRKVIDGKTKFIFVERTPDRVTTYRLSRWLYNAGQKNPRRKLSKKVDKARSNLQNRIRLIRTNFKKGLLPFESLAEAEDIVRNITNSTSVKSSNIENALLNGADILREERFGASTQKAVTSGKRFVGRDYLADAKRYNIPVDKKLYNSDEVYKLKILRLVYNEKRVTDNAKKVLHDMVSANTQYLLGENADIDGIRNTIDDLHKNKTSGALWDYKKSLEGKHIGMRPKDWFFDSKKGLYGLAGDRVYNLVHRAEKMGLTPNLTARQFEQLRGLAMYSILTPGSHMDHIIPLLHKPGTASDPLNIDIVTATDNLKKQGNLDYKTKSLLPEKYNPDQIFDIVNDRIKEFKKVDIPRYINMGVLDNKTAQLIQVGEWGSDASFKGLTVGGKEIKFSGRRPSRFLKSPKTMIAGAIAAPFALAYSAMAKSDPTPSDWLNRSDPLFTNQALDNLLQGAKYHTVKPGGGIDYISLLDSTDLMFYGRGQNKYNMNIKDIEGRKMVDPTWRRTGLLETQGDKSTILDRRPEFWNRKRESIWT